MALLLYLVSVKKERNPAGISFANVYRELRMLHIQDPLAPLRKNNRAIAVILYSKGYELFTQSLFKQMRFF